MPPDNDELQSVRAHDDEEEYFDGYDTGDEFIRESAASPASPSSPHSDGIQRDNNLTKESPEYSTNSPLSKGPQIVKSTTTYSENGMNLHE